MRIVSHKRLKEFYETKGREDSRVALERWYDVAEKAEWKNLSDIKVDFPATDYVGNQHYVFNIRGNNYRLIVVVKFTIGYIFIRKVCTHEEYDKIAAEYNTSPLEQLTITLQAPDKDACYERINVEQKFGDVTGFAEWLRSRPMPEPQKFDLNAFTPQMLYEVLSREDSEYYCQLEKDDPADLDADEDDEDEAFPEGVVF